MTLPLRDFPTMTNAMVAAAQAECPQLTDFSEGSPSLALINAGGFNAMYLQFLVTLVLGTTRLATSFGSDVDSFVGDFGVTRLAPVATTGAVTYGRYVAATADASIPVGALVKTQDNITFQVIAPSAARSDFDATAQAYTFAASLLSISVPVQAVVGGTGSNVQANTIVLSASSLTGQVNTVTNPAPITNGLDGESDAALKVRFSEFISSRTLGTLGAITAAITGVQQGLSFAIVENGTPTTGLAGYFAIFVDDGSGNPPQSLITAIGNAVYPVRAASVTFAVFPASVATVAVSAQVTPLPGYSSLTLIPAISNAIQGYINTLGVGVPLYYSKLSNLISSVEGVDHIEAFTLNGAMNDVGVIQSQVLRSAPPTVS